MSRDVKRSSWSSQETSSGEGHDPLRAIIKERDAIKEEKRENAFNSIVEQSSGTEIISHLEQLDDQRKEANLDQPDTQWQKTKKKLKRDYRSKAERVRAANEQILADGAEIAKLPKINIEHIKDLKIRIDSAIYLTKLAIKDKEHPHKNRLEAVDIIERIRDHIQRWKLHLVDGVGAPPDTLPHQYPGGELKTDAKKIRITQEVIGKLRKRTDYNSLPECVKGYLEIYPMLHRSILKLDSKHEECRERAIQCTNAEEWKKIVKELKESIDDFIESSANKIGINLLSETASFILKYPSNSEIESLPSYGERLETWRSVLQFQIDKPVDPRIIKPSEEAFRLKVVDPSNLHHLDKISLNKQVQEFLRDVPLRLETILIRLEEIHNKVDARTRLLQDAQINIWNGKLNKEDVANLMKTGKMIESMTITQTSSEPRKITLDNGITGIYKSRGNDVPAIDTRPESKYESEIAAYKIAQLLGGVRVPLTVKCKIKGEKGSLQLWVNDLEPPTQNYSGSRRVDDLGSPETMNSDQSQDSVGSQKTHYPNNIAFFDYLISHGDRDGIHNWGYTPDNVPVLFDNADAFQAKKPMIFSTHITHFIPDKSMLANARKLDMEKLKDIGELSEEQKEDFLARRDKLIGLIDRYGILV